MCDDACRKRPLYAGIERSLPEPLSENDQRLVRAFKQRYERLVAASARLPLERLCEEITATTTGVYGFAGITP